MSSMKGSAYIVCLSSVLLLCLALSIVSATSEDTAEVDNALLFGPGDRKQGYDSKDYRTNSVSLDRRIGKAADPVSYTHLTLPTIYSV